MMLEEKFSKFMFELRAFLEREVYPHTVEWDRKGFIPNSTLDGLKGLGCFGGLISEKHEGMGFSNKQYGFFLEEVARAYTSLSSLLTVHGMVSYTIEKWGAKSLKKEFLPSLALGESIGAMAITEKHAGSDIKSIESLALDTAEGEFELKGEKRWVTGGQIANLFLVYAKTPGGFGAFLIPSTIKGLSREPVENMLGFRGAMLANLKMDSCFVPKGYLLGNSQNGLSHIAALALDLGRYSIAWSCVGLMKACLQAMNNYISKREQFGHKMEENQLVQRLVAKSISAIETSELLCESASNYRDEDDPRSIMKSLVAKYHSSKSLSVTSQDAVQLLGARGCHESFLVERYFRDSKIMEIIEGSTEVLETLIAQYRYGIASPRFFKGDREY